MPTDQFTTDDLGDGEARLTMTRTEGERVLSVNTHLDPGADYAKARASLRSQLEREWNTTQRAKRPQPKG